MELKCTRTIMEGDTLLFKEGMEYVGWAETGGVIKAKAENGQVYTVSDSGLFRMRDYFRVDTPELESGNYTLTEMEVFIQRLQEKLDRRAEEGWFNPVIVEQYHASYLVGGGWRTEKESVTYYGTAFRVADLFADYLNGHHKFEVEVDWEVKIAQEEMEEIVEIDVVDLGTAPDHLRSSAKIILDISIMPDRHHLLTHEQKEFA